MNKQIRKDQHEDEYESDDLRRSPSSIHKINKKAFFNQLKLDDQKQP